MSAVEVSHEYRRFCRSGILGGALDRRSGPCLSDLLAADGLQEITLRRSAGFAPAGYILRCGSDTIVSARRSIMLKEGDKAPTFSLPDDKGNTVTLDDYTGKKTVVLFFFPKADTPGCTREACGFRDLLDEFKKQKAVVFGVSADSVARQAKFREKYSLTMPLLADPERKVLNDYGVYKEKKMYGKSSMGIERTTFVIGTDGKIKRIFPKVKVDGHVEEVLETLAGL